MSPLFTEVLIILLTIPFLLISPFVLVEVMLMTIYRYLAGQISIFKPKLGQLVSPSSAAFATDLIYNQIQKLPLLVTVYLDGHLNIEDFRERMLRVIDQKDPKTGLLLRPELQQYVTTWAGLLFWKWEESFDVTEHVRIWNEFSHLPELNEDAILEIANALFQKPFTSKKSPWEFLVLHNTRAKEDNTNDPRTTVLFRIHHGLADGYSLLKLVMTDMSNVQIRLAQPIRPQQSQTLVMDQILFPMRCAHDLAKTIVTCWDNNIWHLPAAEMSGQVNGGVSNPIDLKFVKSVKDQHSVTFAALLLAAFTGGIKKFMEENERKTPKQMHCFTVLPFPNHPYTLTNHLTGGFVLLPLDEPSPSRRLRTIHRSLENVKKSTIPTTLYYLLQLAGIQFGWIAFKFLWNGLPTAVMSNFPGPEDKCSCLGHPILDGGFAAGFGPGNATVGFSSLSYNGKLRVATGFDQAVLPKSINCDKLMEAILQELSVLNDESPSIRMIHR